MCPLKEECFIPLKVIFYSSLWQGLQTYSQCNVSEPPCQEIAWKIFILAMGFSGLNTCRIILPHLMEWMDSVGYSSVPQWLACRFDLQRDPRKWHRWLTAATESNNTACVLVYICVHVYCSESGWWYCTIIQLRASAQRVWSCLCCVWRSKTWETV